MDQNPPVSGQQQQHQPPKYDTSQGGHYGMLAVFQSRPRPVP